MKYISVFILSFLYLYANGIQTKNPPTSQYVIVLDINTQKAKLIEKISLLDIDLKDKINIIQLSDSVYATYSKPFTNKTELDELLKKLQESYISAHIQTIDINDYKDAIVINGGQIESRESVTDIDVDLFGQNSVDDLLFSGEIQSSYANVLCQDIYDKNISYKRFEKEIDLSKTASYEDLAITLRKNEQDQLKYYENKNIFKGFYLEGRFEQYLNEDYEFRQDVDYEYRINARWEIFKNGYYEYEKIQKKEENKAKQRYLRLLSHVLDRYHENRGFDIESLKRQVEYLYNNHLEKAYLKLLKKREKQLQDGFTTMDDVYHVKERLENIRILKRLDASTEAKSTDEAILVFLQSLECVELVEKEWVLAYEDEHNIQLQLQENLIDELQFSAEYTDELKVTLFTEHRNIDRVGWYNTAGIKIDIPLGWDNERSDIQRLEKANLEIEKRVYTENLQKHTSYLYAQFDYSQRMLKVLQNKLKYLHLRQKQLDLMSDNAITGYRSNPDREMDLLEIRALDLKYAIMMKRIEIYEYLLKLYKLSGVENIQSLLKYKEGGS